MERKNSSCPLGACEKILKSFTFGPAFRTIRRRISQHPQDPIPSNHITNSSSIPILITHVSSPHAKPTAAPHHPKTNKNRSSTAEMIPVKFDYSSLPTPPPNPVQKKNAQLANASTYKTGNGQVAKVGKVTNVVVGNGGKSHGQGTKTTLKVEQPRVNRGSSNLGVSIEDRFTDYINQAKIKIRTTSNVGGDRKIVSGEDKVRDHHFSDYISRAKIRIRTMSSFGGGRSDSFK